MTDPVRTALEELVRKATQTGMPHHADWQPLFAQAQAALDATAVKTTTTERHTGVIISTNSKGAESRVSAKCWDRSYEGQPNDWVTLSIYIGDHRWIEEELHRDDALKLAAIIQHKATPTPNNS